MNTVAKADIHILVLAAGASSRLGQPKQMVEHNRLPLWQKAVDIGVNLEIPTYLTTGSWQPRSLLPANVHEIPVKNWHLGMGESISTGIKHMPIPQKGYLIILCDQWGLTFKSVKRFIDLWDGTSIQIAIENAYSGPPVLFPVDFRSQLLKLTGDHGARTLLKSQQPKRIPVPQASWDLDTEDDLFLLNELSSADNNKELQYDFT